MNPVRQGMVLGFLFFGVFSGCAGNKAQKVPAPAVLPIPVPSPGLKVPETPPPQPIVPPKPVNKMPPKPVKVIGKINVRTGQVFPLNYVYDPNTGETLLPVEE